MSSRSRLVVTSATLAAVLLTGVGLLLLGGGGDSATGDPAGYGPLSWKGTPELYRHETLPNDRILSGEVRNDSLRRFEMEARELVLQGPQGGRIAAAAVFLASFTHGLFPPADADRVPEAERVRLGQLLSLEPGKSAPLTIAWRERPGGRGRPVRIDYGRGSLAVPKTPKR